MRFLFLFLPFVIPFTRSYGQTSHPPATSNGYNCSSDRSVYPCQAYAFYRAGSTTGPGPYPPLTDLPSIGDLFGLSRLTIARASNLPSKASSLSPGQPLLIPLTCACGSAANISNAPVHYRIDANDTYYQVSAYKFGNLTSYPAVMAANPSLDAYNLTIGVDAVFPVFCQCPPAAGRNGSSPKTLFITYSFQPNDTYASLAAEFGTDTRSLESVNGPESRLTPYLTVLIPVSSVPPPVILNYNETSPPPPPPAVVVEENERDGVVIGLAVGLGLMGILWAILTLGLAWLWREGYFGKRRNWGEAAEGGGMHNSREDKKKFVRSASDEKLMTDISEWLDKYKVYRMEELAEATAGFDRSRLIQGSVYRGTIDGEVCAIKKMKWNACDELKILQKVNHTNLVKLEGFCIEPDAGTCYLVYEYVENGDLNSWLHDPARARTLDVFAYGVVLLELVSGREATSEEGELLWMEVEGIFAKRDGRVEGRILAWMDKAIFIEERSTGSVESVTNVMNIARACLQKDPAKRPSMVDVAYTLSKSDDMFSDFSEDGLGVGAGDVMGR